MTKLKPSKRQVKIFERLVETVDNAILTRNVLENYVSAIEYNLSRYEHDDYWTNRAINVLKYAYAELKL